MAKNYFEIQLKKIKQKTKHKKSGGFTKPKFGLAAVKLTLACLHTNPTLKKNPTDKLN